MSKLLKRFACVLVLIFLMGNINMFIFKEDIIEYLDGGK